MNKKKIVEEILNGIAFTVLFFTTIFGLSFISIIL